MPAAEGIYQYTQLRLSYVLVKVIIKFNVCTAITSAIKVTHSHSMYKTSAGSYKNGAAISDVCHTHVYGVYCQSITGLQTWSHRPLPLALPLQQWQWLAVPWGGVAAHS